VELREAKDGKEGEEEEHRVEENETGDDEPPDIYRTVEFQGEDDYHW